MSGYPAFSAKLGIPNMYQRSPRAEIFRRDQGTVTDMKSMIAIMRYNGTPLEVSINERQIKPSDFISVKKLGGHLFPLGIRL